MLFPVSDELRHIYGKGSAAAEVSSSKTSVDEDFAVEIDCTEVEHHVASCPVLGHLDVALVPNVVDKVCVAYAAEFALGTERYGNLSLEALTLEEFLLHAGAYKIKSVGPVTIEVKPVLAFELWTRVLSPGQSPSSGHRAEQQERKEQSFHLIIHNWLLLVQR